MQFFNSFSSLGYSAVNIVLIFMVILAVIFRSLGFHTRSSKFQLSALFGLMLIFSIPFVWTVNFLASENNRLNEAVRQDGGLKVNVPKLEPTN